VKVEVGKQARHTLSEHGLADSWWPMEEHVMSAGGGYVAGPLGLQLPDHVGKIEAALGVLAGRITHHLDRIDQWQGFIPEQGDQLGDRGNAEDIDACDEFRFSGLPQWHDHPGKTRLLGRKRGGQTPRIGRTRPSNPSSPSRAVRRSSSA
jgi:hypothetical protein